MKIGVITFWQSNDNYGQQLQCWALQQALKDLGHAPYIIRYDVENRPQRKDSLRGLKLIIKFLLVIPYLKYCKKLIALKNKRKDIEKIETKNKQRCFEPFREENLKFSDNIYHSLEDLKRNPPVADAYIVGSDQVWAQLLSNPENQSFFLDFGKADILRIAYAPSFSLNEYPRKLREKLANNLKRFTALSVREKTGSEICKTVGFDAPVVLDPTFLLSRNRYLSLQKNIKEIVDTYIYVYSINILSKEELQWQEIKEFAQNKKYKIITTTSSGHIPGKELLDECEYDYASIPQWLSYIRNAQLVVTTSFHGIAFCIINNTPFIYFPLKGELSGGNNRVVDLLRDLMLEDRIYNDSVSIADMASQSIDWNKVNNTLNVLRGKSYTYIKVSLCGYI